MTATALALPSKRRRLTRDGLSALCGVGWGLVALALMPYYWNGAVAGGVIAAPAIGVLVGRIARPFATAGRAAHVVVPLLTLYLAAVLFAISVGTADFLLRAGSSSFAASVSQIVSAVIWGLTFYGYWILLWPLAFVTHSIVWRSARSGGETAAVSVPEISFTSDAIRRLALLVMLMAVVFCALSAGLALYHYGAMWRAGQLPFDWWLNGTARRWGSWLVFAWFMWLAAPVISTAATLAIEADEPRTTRWSHVVALCGVVLILYPFLSLASTWFVTIIRIGLVQGWFSEGRLFVSADYYLRVLGLYGWSLALGATLIGIGRLRA